MQLREPKMQLWGKVLFYLWLTVIAIMFLIPVLWALSSSFRPLDEIFKYANPISWRTFISTRFTLSSYIKLFTIKQVPYGRAVLNSLFIAISTIALGLFANSLAGFSFAKFDFLGKNFLFVLVLLSFMVPFEVIVIPLYLLVKAWNMTNTYYALILPAFANGLAIFLFKQFFEEIPTALIEAARIDGASWFIVYGRIILPLSIPVIICVSMMLFLGQWDSLFWPLVAATVDELIVVQVAIIRFWGQYAVQWDLIIAGSMFASAVPVFIFLVFQRYYVGGIARTGLKG